MDKVGLFNRRSKDPIVTETLQAAEQGLKAVGLSPVVALEEQYEACQVAVVFGQYKKRSHKTSKYRRRIYRMQRVRDLKVLALEQGYFYRKKYRSCGWNNINGFADFRFKNHDSARFDELKQYGWYLRPWQRAGENVVICGQVPWDVSVQHLDYQQWVQETAWELAKHTGRRILFRPHPLQPGAVRGFGVEMSRNRPIELELQSTWATVTYNSTTSCESLIYGVPTFVLDHRSGSVAYPVAEHSLENIESPERKPREQWAYNLAYAQWTCEEIAEGKPFLHLGLLEELSG